MHGQALLNNPNYQPKEFVYSARDRWDEIMDCSRTVVGPRFKYIHNFMPEVPYDAGQKYLDIIEVRPILPCSGNEQIRQTVSGTGSLLQLSKRS